MSLWGNTANANSAPKYHILATSKARGNTLYSNTNLDAFTQNQVVGVFPANSTTANNNGFKMSHDGWVLVRTGTGPVTKFTVTNGGSGYSNLDIAKVVSYDTNNAPALGAITTYANGTINTVTLTSSSSGFLGTETAVVANSTGGTANGTLAAFSLTFGGRAGRKQYETLVAAGTIQATANVP